MLCVKSNIDIKTTKLAKTETKRIGYETSFSEPNKSKRMEVVFTKTK